MSDTLTVREPCEHKLHDYHLWDIDCGEEECPYENWRHRVIECPGGREIVLRMRTFRAPVEGAGFPRWLESEWEWSDSPWEEQNG